MTLGTSRFLPSLIACQPRSEESAAKREDEAFVMKERSRTNGWCSISIISFSLIILSHWAHTPRVAGQQPPQQPKTAEQAFKNIQVIKSMPAGQLQNAMSFMAASLGVDCSHCHTPPAMEKDDKPAKQTAR